MAKYILNVHETCLKEMVFSAVEAYAIPHSEDFWGRVMKETYGTLWGSSRELPNGQVFIDISFLSTETSAGREEDGVDPVEEATWTKAHIAETFWPETHLIGDFHTHPFGKGMTEEIEKKDLWRFSSQDKKTQKESLESLPKGYTYFASTVMTVTQNEKERKRAAEIYKNIFVFDLGKYTFYFSACLACRTGNAVRLVSEESSHIEMRCPLFCPSRDFAGRMKEYVYV
jgi:hypothetical protein